MRATGPLAFAVKKRNWCSDDRRETGPATTWFEDAKVTKPTTAPVNQAVIRSTTKSMNDESFDPVVWVWVWVSREKFTQCQRGNHV